MSWSPTHSTRRPGCWSWSTSGHTQPIGRRSAGGELVAPVHDLGDGDAVGQVQVGAPAGAVAGDRGLELDRGARVLRDGLRQRRRCRALPARATTMSLVSFSTRFGTTARSISGAASAGRPSTPSAATGGEQCGPVRQRRSGHRNNDQPGDQRAAARPRSRSAGRRTRASRCRDSFRYAPASARSTVATRTGWPSRSNAHRTRPPVTRRAPRGARGRELQPVLRGAGGVVARSRGRSARPGTRPIAAASARDRSGPGMTGRRLRCAARRSASQSRGLSPGWSTGTYGPLDRPACRAVTGVPAGRSDAVVDLAGDGGPSSPGRGGSRRRGRRPRAGTVIVVPGGSPGVVGWHGGCSFHWPGRG